MSKIKQVWAREIIDSRGFPTIEAAMMLDSGHVVSASVPSGVSIGKHESLELRDNDEKRFAGKGVLKAVSNINQTLGPGVIGMDPQDQKGIDNKLKEIDGTEDKSKMGANSLLAVSLVTAKATAAASGKSIFLIINELCNTIGLKRQVKMPTPLFNMIEGGMHGAANLDFQEFHVIPATNKTYTEALRIGVEIYISVGENLMRRGAIHSVGDEGGYAPNLFKNSDAFEILIESIKLANYSLGRDIFLGLDVAANSFYKDGAYSIKDSTTPLDDNKLAEYYKQLNNQYKLAIIEDAFHEEAWDSWKKLTTLIGSQALIVGDDLLVTNPKRVEKAISQKACNSAIIKPNQAGTITETIQVMKMVVDAGWKTVVSHRGGETNDSFIADFSVGVGSEYVKFGAPARGERVAKYNRLLSIETELKRIQK